MSTALDALRTNLSSVAPGPVVDPQAAQLEGLLEAAWDGLRGGHVAGMVGGKLFARTEELAWDPPIVSFRIERHGATALGSSRAALHYWEVDVVAGTATLVREGFRQLSPRDQPWDAGAAARELAQLIRSGSQDPRLEWRGEHKVRLRLDQVLPPSRAKQTKEGRSRRFRDALDTELGGEWSYGRGIARRLSR